MYNYAEICSFSLKEINFAALATDSRWPKTPNQFVACGVYEQNEAHCKIAAKFCFLVAVPILAVEI